MYNKIFFFQFEAFRLFRVVFMYLGFSKNRSTLIIPLLFNFCENFSKLNYIFKMFLPFTIPMASHPLNSLMPLELCEFPSFSLPNQFYFRKAFCSNEYWREKLGTHIFVSDNFVLLSYFRLEEIFTPFFLSPVLRCLVTDDKNVFNVQCESKLIDYLANSIFNVFPSLSSRCSNWWIGDGINKKWNSIKDNNIHSIWWLDENNSK